MQAVQFKSIARPDIKRTNILFMREGGVYAGAIEADDDGAIYVQHGYACLTGFLHGFFGVFTLFVYVFFGVFHTGAVKVLLCSMTEPTPLS